MIDKLDEMKEAEQAVIPPLRTFLVTRRTPTDATKTEVVTVHAHSAQVDSGVISFIELDIEPGFGAVARMRRVFGRGEWVDIEEVVVKQSSGLIVH